MMLKWIKGRLPRFQRTQLIDRARMALHEGQFEKAREYCASLLARRPKDVRLLTLMAAMAADARNLEEGMEWALAAAAADARAAEPHYIMGRLEDLAGRQPEAERSYRRAVQLEPRHAKAHNNLGCVLRLQGKFHEALACFERAQQLDPGQAEANQNVAAMTNDSVAREAAIRGYLRQIAAEPRDARALNNLANIYSGAGQFQEAMEALQQVVALEPDRAEAHYSLALLLLLAGNYEEGWKEYQWRWRINNKLSAPMRRFGSPAWDGSPVAGAVLLHGELAFGESLQFVRYAALAAEQSTGVIFECSASLKPLLSRVRGVSHIVTPGEPLPPFAAHAPLFCLPRIFGTTLGNIPSPAPYIRVETAKAVEWQRLLELQPARLKVGVVWRGNALNPNDHDRSTRLRAFAPLHDVPGVLLYSLQKDRLAADADALPRGMTLIDLMPRILDFSDTAALMSCLDLVISVDTAVAHLAGAMGVPVWVLLNRVPDWRYHMERLDNPWYPSMRLYRQQREGDWGEVIDRVAGDLARMAA